MALIDYKFISHLCCLEMLEILSKNRIPKIVNTQGKGPFCKSVLIIEIFAVFVDT